MEKCFRTAVKLHSQVAGLCYHKIVYKLRDNLNICVQILSNSHRRYRNYKRVRVLCSCVKARPAYFTVLLDCKMTHALIMHQ
jgi:hypothetical protein